MTEQRTETEAGESLVDRLAGCLEQGETYSHNLEIVKKLAGEKSLVEELRARRNNLTLENEQFGNKSRTNEDSWLRGMLFELLTEAEAKKHTPEGDLLTAVMHDPTRYGLETVIPIIKNPDAVNAGFQQKSNTLWLNSVVETKFGLLGYNSFKQLKQFEGAMKMCVDKLNGLKDLDQHGLGLLTAGGRKIEVAADFYVVLVVPRDRDIINRSSLIRTKDFYDQRNVKELGKLLRQVKVRKSSFSSDEVIALAQVLAPLV